MPSHFRSRPPRSYEALSKSKAPLLLRQRPPPLREAPYHHVIPCDVEIPPVSYEDKEPCGRIQLSEEEAEIRKKNFDAFECGMTEQEACQEAGRCLRCDKYGSLMAEMVPLFTESPAS